MNKLAFITGGTPNLAGPAGVFFLSLKFMSGDVYRKADCFFVTNGKLNVEDKVALHDIGVRCETINSNGFTLDSQSKFVDYFSLGILSKFHIFNIMFDYESVIWFDCDQLNTRDLSDILEKTSDNDFFIVGKGADCADGWSNFVDSPSALKKYLEQHTFDFSLPSITGNFYGVNRGRDSGAGRGAIFNDCISLYQRLQSDIYLGEQGVIYIIMQKYFENVARLENHLFTPHPRDWPIERLITTQREFAPYFIHAYGQPKFWSGEDHSLFDFYHDVWIGLGGRGFRESGHLIKMRQRSRMAKRWLLAIKGRLL